MLDRFVAIAVAKSNLAACHACHDNHAVGSRSSVGDIVSPVRPEYLGGISLAIADRSRVIKQRTQLANRYGEIRAKQIFTEEVNKIVEPSAGFGTDHGRGNCDT